MVQINVKVPYAVVGALVSLADQRCYFRHGLDAYDTLDGEVGLVRQAASKVVRADLARRNERFRDQELRPLVQ